MRQQVNVKLRTRRVEGAGQPQPSVTKYALGSRERARFLMPGRSLAVRPANRSILKLVGNSLPGALCRGRCNGSDEGCGGIGIGAELGAGGRCGISTVNVCVGVWDAVFGSLDPPISAPQNTLDKYIFGGAFVPLEVYCTYTVH